MKWLLHAPSGQRMEQGIGQGLLGEGASREATQQRQARLDGVGAPGEPRHLPGRRAGLLSRRQLSSLVGL